MVIDESDSHNLPFNFPLGGDIHRQQVSETGHEFHEMVVKLPRRIDDGHARTIHSDILLLFTYHHFRYKKIYKTEPGQVLDHYTTQVTLCGQQRIPDGGDTRRPQSV